MKWEMLNFQGLMADILIHIYSFNSFHSCYCVHTSLHTIFQYFMYSMLNQTLSVQWGKSMNWVSSLTVWTISKSNTKIQFWPDRKQNHICYINKSVNVARIPVITPVLLKVPVFHNIMLCFWVWPVAFKKQSTLSFRIKQSKIHFDHQTVQMTALWSFETLGNPHPKT